MEGVCLYVCVCVCGQGRWECVRTAGACRPGPTPRLGPWARPADPNLTLPPPPDPFFRLLL